MEICLNEYIKGCTQKIEMLVFKQRQNGVMIKTLIFGVWHSRAGVIAVVTLGKLFNLSEPQFSHL